MKPVEPIFVSDRFPELQYELLSLLWGLSADDWYKPTVCGDWTVKDLVAHMLDVQIRRVSSQRDGVSVRSNSPLESYTDIVGFINDNNAQWVHVAARISPKLLISFIAIVGDELSQFFAQLDPLAPAHVSVAWAGESESRQWFDIAREYTELWLHQQQIREAVGQPLLTNYRVMQPVLDTYLRAMPHTYRNVEAPDGTSIWVCITGEAGDDWTLLREEGAWHLYSGHLTNPTARIQMEQDIAWRVFTKGLSPAEALKRVKIEGDKELGAKVLDMVSIMA